MSVPMSVSNSTGTGWAGGRGREQRKDGGKQGAWDHRRLQVGGTGRQHSRRGRRVAAAAISGAEDGAAFARCPSRAPRRSAKTGGIATGARRPAACKGGGVLARIRTAALFGLDAVLVFAEVDVSNGFPGLTLVGLPDASVRESGDRVRTAIRNSGFEYPRTRITVNLSPADVRKVGAGFDLPIALGILAAGGVVPTRSLEDCLVVGELSLDGGIQPTRGVLPAMVAARRRRPAPRDPADGQRREAAIVPDTAIVAVDTLDRS